MLEAQGPGNRELVELRHFGPPKSLLTDEGRGWCSDAFSEWCGNHNVEHLVAPGEAHNRLGVVERRHVEIYTSDLNLEDIGGLRSIPQVNASPTVARFGPTQWVLGLQPSTRTAVRGGFESGARRRQ